MVEAINPRVLWLNVFPILLKKKKTRIVTVIEEDFHGANFMT